MMNKELVKKSKNLLRRYTFNQFIAWLSYGLIFIYLWGYESPNKAFDLYLFLCLFLSSGITVLFLITHKSIENELTIEAIKSVKSVKIVNLYRYWLSNRIATYKKIQKWYEQLQSICSITNKDIQDDEDALIDLGIEYNADVMVIKDENNRGIFKEGKILFRLFYNCRNGCIFFVNTNNDCIVMPIKYMAESKLNFLNGLQWMLHSIKEGHIKILIAQWILVGWSDIFACFKNQELEVVNYEEE